MPRCIEITLQPWVIDRDEIPQDLPPNEMRVKVRGGRVLTIRSHPKGAGWNKYASELAGKAVHGDVVVYDRARDFTMIDYNFI